MWELAARGIAAVANGPKIVIEKSTLPVRTAHSMVPLTLHPFAGVPFLVCVFHQHDQDECVLFGEAASAECQ